MRVADINMTRPNENCPAGFRKITASGKTMCGGQGWLPPAKAWLREARSDRGAWDGRLKGRHCCLGACV